MKIIFKKYNHLNIESILLRLGSNGDVCPIQIQSIRYRVGKPYEEKEVDIVVGNYFTKKSEARLYLFKPFTKEIYFWQIDEVI
jgi:hypothetical protein